MIRSCRARSAFWFWLSVAAAPLSLAGCGASSEDPFQGAGEFTLTTVGSDGKPSEQRIASQPKLQLRRGQRGGTDLVLARSCALRSASGNVTGTYACRIPSSQGSAALLLQSGTWKLTESIVSSSAGGCPLHRYELTLDATGTIQGISGSTAALHFVGRRELKACPRNGGGGGTSGGIYSDSPWVWTEDPYVGDGTEGYGYDWDGDGDWDGDASGSGDPYDDGSGDTGGEDDGSWDDGGGDDGGGGGGDDSGGGGDDGGGGGGDDGGDWATGHRPKSAKTHSAAAQSKNRQPAAARDASK